ncbi:hypothetical protein ACQ5SO_05540 [Rhodovulum sp. DZ06]|uniref:hypothetical protein n=1 Tax=Rhodovulum sp. DZ06 TaxID=3425126 RepID=UPI003D343A18
MSTRSIFTAALVAAALSAPALLAATPAGAQTPRAQGPLAKNRQALPTEPGVYPLRKDGSWVLGLRRMENNVASCFAGVGNPQQQVFEYMSFNVGLSMFRFLGPELAEVENNAELRIILRIDAGENRGMVGRMINGAATFPVDDASEAKRALIRALADGRTLYVHDARGQRIGQFPLDGARTILTAFGPCKGKLPPAPKNIQAQ